MAGDAESLLKGQCTKFHLQPLTLDSDRKRQSGLEMHEESGADGSREDPNLKDPCAQSFPIL